MKGPAAVEAVEREFKYLQDWSEDRWQYVGVIVTLLDTEGNPTDGRDALWGIDDNGDYAKRCAYDIALDIYSRVRHCGE